MKKIKVTAVSYLNTKPLLYGILRSPIAQKMDLSLDIPAKCAARLKSGEVDLGLVPVAILPELNEPTIISNYCIGAVGAVNTVCIYSQVPIEETTDLWLDHHSRTSVALTKILLKEYWGINPTLLPAQEGYISQIKGSTAGLVIGDRTIGLENKFKYIYDLGRFGNVTPVYPLFLLHGSPQRS